MRYDSNHHDTLLDEVGREVGQNQLALLYLLHCAEKPIVKYMSGLSGALSDLTS